MKVNIKRILPDAQLPTYGTKDAAGFDIYAAEDISIQPKQLARIRSGLIIESPAGYFLAIMPRSSTPRKMGLMFPHSIGIIDPDYSGPNDEILIQVYNFTDQVSQVKTGDRIAQGMFLPMQQVTWDETENLTNETRGGFGSSGQ